jgi:hypothetical protein
MAYTPVTMPAGAILATNPAGQGVQDNLDKMRNYVDGGVIAADIAADGWVQSKHIMRGHYDPIVNMHSFVSGLDGGQVADDTQLSFLGDGPTGRNNPNTPTKKPYPNTTVEFYLEDNADVMFQFSAYPHTPDMNALNFNYASRLFIYLDDTEVVASRAWTTHVASGVTRVPKQLAHYQNPWSGFYVAKNLAAGQHSIGLRGFTRARYSFLTKWSISLEAFYR